MNDRLLASAPREHFVRASDPNCYLLLMLACLPLLPPGGKLIAQLRLPCFAVAPPLHAQQSPNSCLKNKRPPHANRRLHILVHRFGNDLPLSWVTTLPSYVLYLFTIYLLYKSSPPSFPYVIR